MNYLLTAYARARAVRFNRNVCPKPLINCWNFNKWAPHCVRYSPLFFPPKKMPVNFLRCLINPFRTDAVNEKANHLAIFHDPTANITIIFYGCFFVPFFSVFHVRERSSELTTVTVGHSVYGKFCAISFNCSVWHKGNFVLFLSMILFGCYVRTLA